MKRYIFILFLSTPFFLFSQQITPFKATDLEQAYIWNPAMTAAWDQVETVLNYNQNWLSFNGAPTHARLGYQFPFTSYNMGVGVFGNWDKTGPLSTYNFGLTYSYRLHLGMTYEDQLLIGTSAIFSQYLWNNQELFATDTDDTFILDMERSGPFKTNFGFGIYYCTTSSTKYDDSYLFVGVGTNRILSQDVFFGTENNTNLKRVFHGNMIVGYRFNNDFSFIEPSVRLELAAPNIFLITAGLQYEYDQLFWTGIHYSSDNSFHLSLGGILKDVLSGNLKIGVRGNYNIGEVVANTQGFSYEVFVGHIYEFY